jgi:GTP-binding protein
VLLHLIDGTEEDVASAYRTVRGELTAYGGGLAEKAEIVGLNKADALDPETRKQKLAALKKAARERDPGAEVLCLSGVSGEGVEAVVTRLWQHIEAERRRRREAAEAPSGNFRP